MIGGDPDFDDRTDPALDQGAVRERQSGRRRSRRRDGATISTISWRDIPAQLTARVGGESRKVLLHARFQHAIDRAAAVAGLTSTDDYVNEWRTVTQPLDGVDVSGLDEHLDQRCADLEERYPRERLEALVADGGLDVASDDPPSESDTT